MGNKELGIADPVYDALRIRSGQSIAPDLGGGTTGGSGLENKIYVWHADGSTIDTFDPDSAGLDLAIAAAASGDTIWLPACTISGDHTVPAGVALAGISREQSILTGEITLGSGSIVINAGIIRTGTSANLTCLVGPGSGAARAVSCKLSVTTTSGTPLAASSSGANTLYLEDCDVAAIKNGSAVTPFAASAETLVDTFAIDSANGAYQSGAYTTSVTKSYRVEVTGAVQHSVPLANALADSAYITWNNFATYTAVDTISFSDLHGGGTCPPDNGAYAASHVYNFTRTGNGTVFSMRFADVGGWSNNAGSFTVNVYEIANADVNLEGCVLNGAWSSVPEWGDRAVRDALAYSTRHANDIDTGIHWTRAELDSLYSSTPGIEWFNVKTYGAVGDGSADDTFSIANAIASIPAIGGVLYFPAGNYLVSSGFTLAKSITVRGDGSPQGLVEGPVSKISFTSATESLFAVTSHGCSFKDICLNNTAGTTPSAGAAITVTAGNIANYDNVIILRFWINIDMQDDATVWAMNHCTLANPIKYGLKIANASNPDAGDWSISNCTFVSATAADAAIRLESSGGGKITNTKIIGGAAIFVQGIDVSIAAGDATTILLISNSSIEWVSGDGIHVRNTTTSSWHQIIIHGVQFGLYSNTGGHAVSVVGVSAQHLEDVIVDACVFKASGAPGSAIDLQYVDRAFIGTYINDGFSSLLTTSNTTDIKQIGLGSGSVTSIAAGTGISATPDPIVTTGTIALNAALNDLNDVDTSGTTTGDIIYNSGTGWVDYPLGIGSLITASGTKIRFGNVGGGNYLEIDAVTGTLRLAGDATAWDDIRITANVVKAGATAPNYKAFGPSGNLQALMFEAGHHDEATFSVQLPHQWKIGTNIYPHVHWAPVNTTAGNVVWELEYAWANIDSAFGAPGNMATDATAAGGTAWVHKLTDLKESGNNYISGTGKTMSSMLMCRIHRNSNSGSDTLNQDVALLEIDFHFEIDSFGSDTRDVKDASASLLLESGDILLLESGDRLLLE